MSPGASLWWACLLPRGRVARSVYCVGGVVFGMCGGGHAVFHDVEFPCAEWWLAYLWTRSWSLNMHLCGCVSKLVSGVVVLSLCCVLW